MEEKKTYSRRRLKAEREPDYIDELLHKLRSEYEGGKRVGITAILEDVMNELMKRDRDNFLKNEVQLPQNGFYGRKLNLTLGDLDLKIPRVRMGSAYRPFILPPRWKRIDKDYEEMLIAMLCNGYTYSQIERTCKQMKIPFSREAINDALEFIKEKMEYYKNRELDKEWLAVFIDACHTNIRDENRKNHKSVIYIACGINRDGNKEVLGFWTLKGSENKAFWTEVLQDLIQRGATKILSIITDNFSGLGEVIRKLYPLAYRQLCMVHLSRNLYRNLKKKNLKEAMRLWRDIKDARNYEEGQIYFEKLIEIVKLEKPDMAKQLSIQQNDYLTFLLFPEETRKHFYTTNAVESINSGIERMRVDLGGYFASVKALEVNLFIQIANLQDLWLRKPMPIIKAYLYELDQLFNLKYGD